MTYTLSGSAICASVYVSYNEAAGVTVGASVGMGVPLGSLPISISTNLLSAGVSFNGLTGMSYSISAATYNNGQWSVDPSIAVSVTGKAVKLRTKRNKPPVVEFETMELNLGSPAGSGDEPIYIQDVISQIMKDLGVGESIKGSDLDNYHDDLSKIGYLIDKITRTESGFRVQMNDAGKAVALFSKVNIESTINVKVIPANIPHKGENYPAYYINVQGVGNSNASYFLFRNHYSFSGLGNTWEELNYKL